jgi:mono/diheme cytochrome c family protein
VIHLAAPFLSLEVKMHGKYLAVGTVALVIFGSRFQASQRSEAKGNTGSDTAELVKHGEYLVSQVAHCGDCHTPRDAKGEPDRSKLLQGSTLEFAPKKKTEHWADKSPDITGSGLAGEWSEDEMIRFFTSGESPHGHKPTPPMPVFKLNQKDARAVTLYLKSLSPKKGASAAEKKENGLE